MSLPARAQGHWLKRSVERWNLIAPFDPNVTEREWEKYYKERAALDWYTLVIGLSKKRWRGASQYPPWTEDFPRPKMSNIFEITFGTVKHGNILSKIEMNSMRKAIKSVVDDCPELLHRGLKKGEDLGEKMASGLYFLKAKSEATLDEVNVVELDFVVSTRLYSPFGLGTSIDFELCWEKEIDPNAARRASSQMAIRSASSCRPKKPTVSAVGRSWVPKKYQRLVFIVVERKLPTHHFPFLLLCPLKNFAWQKKLYLDMKICFLNLKYCL